MELEKKTFDLLDLRQVLNSLLSDVWWIVGSAVIAAGIALLVSGVLLPKRYQSEVTILITRPSLSETIKPDRQILLNLPGIKELITLATGDDVITKLNLSTEENVELEILELKDPSQLNSSHIHLLATASDPRRSAQVANLWAEEFLDYLEDRYGSDVVHTEIEQALQNEYPEFDLELAETFLERQEEVLTAKINQAQEALSQDLFFIERCDALLKDMAWFNQELEKNEEDALTEDQKIIFTTIFQRAVIELGTDQVIYPSPDASLDEYSVTRVEEFLEVLSAVVENQKAEIESGISRREALIAFLATQQEDSTNGKVVQIAIQAQPPEQTVGLSPWINASLAGFMAMVVAGLTVLFREWWYAPSLSA